ncbi:MAG: fumarylacetoacetate hydrolase family protein [Proteobacteria bacterium]|nr:fumarylacetoacetate hydrolase family protein [Pseudomonadota bacterium]
MKLASLKHGRDGRLIVVSRDLTRATDASTIVATLQCALDDWTRHGPALAALSARLEQGLAESFAFDQNAVAAPLPRAYQFVDGSAYVNHVELVRKARGASVPATFWTDPLVYQGLSDGFLGPRDPITMSEAWGIDFEGEVIVVVEDVPMGTTRKAALDRIRLIGLLNDISLRNLISPELAKGFGFLQSKPASALAPTLATPDEFGSAWHDGKLHLPLFATVNGATIGHPNAGKDMVFDFGTLIAHVAKTRHLCTGTIIGSGTISNRGSDGGPGQSVEDGGVGYTCLAEIRAVETIELGKPRTPFLKPGDKVRLEILDRDGKSVLGAIEQQVSQDVPN